MRMDSNRWYWISIRQSNTPHTGCIPRRPDIAQGCHFSGTEVTNRLANRPGFGVIRLSSPEGSHPYCIALHALSGCTLPLPNDARQKTWT